MIPGPELHNVLPGDPIGPAFNALVRYERHDQIISGHTSRRRVTPAGTSITCDAPGQSWVHPWKVLLGATEAMVRLGVVSNVVPRINGKALDGDPAPALKINGGPNADLRSWIALRVKVDDDGRLDPDDEESAVIIHTSQMPVLFSDTFALAMLVWRDQRSVLKPHQIVHLNLVHEFGKATGTQRERHYFHGVES